MEPYNPYTGGMFASKELDIPWGMVIIPKETPAIKS